MNVSETFARVQATDLPRHGEHRVNHFILPTLARVIDLTVIGAVGLAAMWFTDLSAPDAIWHHVAILVFVASVYLALANSARLYELGALMRPLTRMDDVLIAIITAALLFLAVAFGFQFAARSDPFWVARFVVGAFVGLALGRLALYRVFDRLSRAGIVGRSLVVLGADEQARRFLRRMRDARPYFTSVVGVFDADGDGRPAQIEGHSVLGGLEELLACARERKIDDVVVAMPWNADQRVMDIVERLKELPLHVYLSTDLVGYELEFTPALGHSSELPLFEVAQRPISGWSAALKTLEDYVLAGAALILISPLLAMIAIAIKIDSPGPVFFMQQRLGFNNKPFAIYKFRSMYHREIPETVVKQAQKGDPRITRVGRFIRATSLDELPQLLNVLNGTMSLVGPRPHALSHNEEYGRQIRGYFARHRVRPGITGWAQVNGLRGETEALELMEARVRCDVYYADNWSLFFDIRILAMTVLVVLFQRTAY